MKGIKNRAAAWILNCLVFIGSYISLFSFWLCINQVKGLSHCSISTVPEFTAKQGNMAINLIRYCCMRSTAPKALLRELHPSRAKRRRLCATKENSKLISKWWYLSCTAWMPFFGKARFFKWSEPLIGYVRRGDKVFLPSFLSLSLHIPGRGLSGPRLQALPHWFWTPTAKELQMLVWLECNSFKGSIFPQFSLKREAAVF